MEFGAAGSASAVDHDEEDIGAVTHRSRSAHLRVIHEIHVMFKRAGAANFRDFTDEEIASFSRAEFIVTRLYEKLNIGSFNEVFLLDRFQRGTGRPRSKFRAIATFITREVDLAVSELSMAYVVDKLPEHTCNEARHYLGEMNLRLAARS
jgi:hypothetical protein